MFLNFIIILVIGLVGAMVAQKIKQPTVTGFLVAGFISSFFLVGHLKGRETLDFIAQIGIAFLLFSLGVEFSFKRLSQVFQVSVFGGAIQVILTILFCQIFFLLFKFSSFEALFLGCCFSMSSTALIVKILAEKGLTETLSGEVLVSWLLVQDLMVIPIMILLSFAGKSTGIGLDSIIWPIGKAIIFISLVLYLGKKIGAKLTYFTSSFNSKEILLLASILLCLITAYLSELIGLSFVLGAFLGGLTIAETLENQAVLSEVKPIRDLFSVVFFVTLPFLADPFQIINNLYLVVAICLMVIVVKFLLSFFISLFFGYHSKISFRVASGLISVGEFAFVLAGIGLKGNLIGRSTYSLILSVSILTLVISPVFFNLAPHLYFSFRSFLKSRFPKMRFLFAKSFDLDIPDEELPYENHVVLCGFGRMGKYIGRAMELSHIPYLVVEINRFLVSELRKAGVNAVYGDPTDKAILDYAQVDKAKLLILALPDFETQQSVITQAKTLNSNLKIISRAHFEDYQKIFKVLGADIVVHPEFSASLEVVRKISQIFGQSENMTDGQIARLKVEHGL